MKRIIMVSNRLPVRITKSNNQIDIVATAGGLATGLSSFFSSHKSLWIGWNGIPRERLNEDEHATVRKKMRRREIVPVSLSKIEIMRYYFGFSNKTIWPLFHYFQMLSKYKETYWNEYVNVNRRFTEIIAGEITPGDIVWIHDYQLMLVPGMLREMFPDIQIGFFLHIPFPDYEVFRLLPWRKEVLEGLMGADLIGFHTYDYAAGFLDCIRNIIGIENNLGVAVYGNRLVKIDAFPMGIDYRKYTESVFNENVRNEALKTVHGMNDKKIVLSVDRLDYTKGILQRIQSFEYFLANCPEYLEKITLILVVSPSRDGIGDYRTIKRVVEEKIAALNGKLGTIEWEPVKYFYRTMSFTEMMGLYIASDIALVTPLRDGMNLIAKEYVAACHDGRGVLILSEFAGSAKELGEAIIVNPYNVREVADSLAKALTMPPEEQAEILRTMHARLKKYDIDQWAEDFLDKLGSIRKENISIKKVTLDSIAVERIVKMFVKRKQALLLLDYDGTLVKFHGRPEHAEPDEPLRVLLKKLASLPNTDVVLISGRDHTSLAAWFGDSGLNLMAEHGAMNFLADTREWETFGSLSMAWKDSILPVLERFTLRTPGSFIEQKRFSLVWHYRKTVPELGRLRATELKNSLASLTRNLNIGVLEGSKTLEIKDMGISKETGCRYWLSRKDYDFVLAAGDDLTDEDMFKALSPDAFSIKVGYAHSNAKYHAESCLNIRGLLGRLTENP
ncbi:MAG: hypothetical protein A2Y33_13900 [Spirochaetes bacterium GWF1_51_8]|nr:MAG: hypothetical protein A2Y33_13900 [Spirochaetes bacterium GWF1_51_8]